MSMKAAAELSPAYYLGWRRGRGRRYMDEGYGGDVGVSLDVIWGREMFMMVDFGMRFILELLIRDIFAVCTNFFVEFLL